MISQSTQNFARRALLAGSAIAATAALALFSGCRGNTTAAASPEHAVSAPPIVTAQEVGGDPLLADPLAGDTWKNARWLPLISPANTTRTTAPTRAAMMFDPSTLYVAFICQQQPTSIARDAVTVYLDTTAAKNGTEMVAITVDSAGQTSATWIRSATPFDVRPDASPDLAHPLSTIPDIRIPRLSTRVSQDAGVWTAVVGVPLKNLPLPLRASASPGTQWKVNLVRTVTTAGEQSELLQSNLSPVYVGAQDLSPRRLADLRLGE